MEKWREVWRNGLAPQLSTKGLQALRYGLETDDPNLTQGATTTPPPLESVLDWPCEGACVVGYAGWLGEGLVEVGEVEDFFAATCSNADVRLGEPAGVRHFLNWFDDTPRDEMRGDLLAEVERELNNRGHDARV